MIEWKLLTVPVFLSLFLVVLQRKLELPHRVIDGFDGLDAVAAEIVIGCLQFPLGFAQFLKGRAHVRMLLSGLLLLLRDNRRMREQQRALANPQHST